jgi:metal-sulfur cluster biosynthetic enzyme
MSRLTVETVMDALATIPEPCSLATSSPTNLRDMGLIESVRIASGTISVVLVLTDPSCVHFLGIRRYVSDTLRALPGVTDVDVTMSTTQLWTEDRVRAAAST